MFRKEFKAGNSGGEGSGRMVHPARFELAT